MILIVVEDVKEALEIAQNLHKIAFRKVANTNSLYTQLGDTIRALGVNLDLLLTVFQRAEYQAGSKPNASRSRRHDPGLDIQVLGNFKQTLRDCEYLLNDLRYFEWSSGFLGNLCDFAKVEPEVKKLLERIVVHNIKLSIVFSTLDPQILEDRAFHIIDATICILQCANQIGQNAHGKHADDSGLGNGVVPVLIPSELEDVFIRTTWQSKNDLFTLDRAIDAAFTYFNNISKQADAILQDYTTYHATIVDIMMAIWLLRTIHDSKDYQVAVIRPPDDVVQLQLEYWGMTVERFFGHFDQLLQEGLRRVLGPSLMLPPTPDLIAIFESQREQLAPVPTSQQSPHIAQISVSEVEAPIVVEVADVPLKWNIPRGQEQHGIKEMHAVLKTSDPGYSETLNIYRHTEMRSSLILTKSCPAEGKHTETIDNYDLGQVQLIPSYALRTWSAPPLEPQTIIFRADTNSPFSRSLVFQQIRDMFDFQQNLTGYRIIHDEARVLATAQESRFLSGSNRQDLGRLQLWSPAPLKNDLGAPSSDSGMSSTSASLKRVSQTSASSSLNYARHTKSKSTPSIFSTTSRSSRSSVVRDKPSYTRTTTSATAMVAALNAPCIVLFALKAPTLSARISGEELSRSFLIIEIDEDTSIEEELNENDEIPKRCVIKKRATYLEARRTQETKDPDAWDLAAAGLYRRDTETEKVKKLKHVIFQFDSQHNLSQFMVKFNQIKAIAALRTAKSFKR